MNKQAEEFVKNANKNNIELYGENGADFIANTAITYSRVMGIINVIPKTETGALATYELLSLAANCSANNAKVLNIPADVMYSYLELGKKMAEKTCDFLKC